MKYTPRVMAAWMQVARKREKRWMLNLMSVMRLAHHGDKRAVEQFVKDMER
jgi:hypothetical protein